MKKDNLELERQLLSKYNNDLKKIQLTLKSIVSKKSSTKNYGDVIIDIKNVSKKYSTGKHKVHALKNISLSIQAGEYVALTGASGSGKSTLLQSIGGLDKIDKGVILVDGEDISKLNDNKLATFRNNTIGFVFQFFYLQPFLNLSTNLEVPAMFSRTPKKDRIAKINELATTLGLSDRLTHFPNELSGGQMQRAAIARALLNNPKILLADEPTGNLDHANALAIMDLFEEIRQKLGTTIIVVTHDSHLASRADREISLFDGEITS